MWIQYNTSDGDLVQIQATNSIKVSDEALAERGRAQYEIPDDLDIVNVLVNIVTGEIIKQTQD